ncbi:DUF4192 domain-containing protein [Actinoplanes sp. NPDC051346]|uniref:DUF4192 domain-containing protein n=1 Tax=Actinoplanes sp. NPDC051346 TaxID=3155048 RepID=UPI0034305B94
MTKLKVRTPAELIAAVPFLIGFHPTDSLVVAAVKDAKLAFAARIDLPEPGVPDLEARAPVLHLATLIVEQCPEAIALIGYGRSDRVTPSLLHLSDALKKAGVRIIDEFRVAGGRYWSYLCTNPTCCPEDGRPCDPPDSVLATEATFAGAVALPSRKDLEAQLAPVTGVERAAMDSADDRAMARLLDLLRQEPAQEGGPAAPVEEGDVAAPAEEGGAAAPADERSRCERLMLRAGRTAIRSAERRYRSGGRLSDEEVAWLGYLLTSLPVRDYAWIRSGTDDWQVALWSDMVRRVAPGRVPAPASLLAFIAWRAGMGALSAIAVERALEADQHYSLAVTMNATLYSAVSPSVVAGWPTPTGRPAPTEPGGAWPGELHRAESGSNPSGSDTHENGPNTQPYGSGTEAISQSSNATCGTAGGPEIRDSEVGGPESRDSEVGWPESRSSEVGWPESRSSEVGRPQSRSSEVSGPESRGREEGIATSQSPGEAMVEPSGEARRTAGPGSKAHQTAEQGNGVSQTPKSGSGRQGSPIGEMQKPRCHIAGPHRRWTKPGGETRSWGRPERPSSRETTFDGTEQRRTTHRRP